MFRFTLRDMLWLMVIIALACAWAVSDRRTNKQWRSRLNRAGAEALQFKNLYANERNYREQLENGTLPPVSEPELRDLLTDPTGITQP